MVLDRLPPCNLDAEETVLGSVLADDTALARVGALVQPDDFFRTQHQRIYAAALAVSARGEPTNSLMLSVELGQRGELEAIGGPAFLTQLSTDLPTAVGVEHAARLVARDAAYRRLISAAGAIARLAFEGGPDFTGALATCYALIREVAGGQAVTTWEQASTILDREWPAIAARLADPAADRGITTGWPSLNRLLYSGGLLRGALYTWLAQTSIGKSTVGRTLLRNVALAGHDCALFTLEQSPETTVEQILLSMAGIDAHWHRTTGEPLSETHWAALEAARNRFAADLHRLHIDGTAGVTPAQVRLRIAELCATRDVAVVAIDYLHRMRPDHESRNANEAQVLGEIARSLADTAKEFNVALVLFAQLNRQNLDRDRRGDDFRPHIGDLHGTSNLEKVSFGIVGLHRRQWYVQQGKLEAKLGTEDDLELLILKQQLGPAGGRATLRFDGALGRVEDCWGAS